VSSSPEATRARAQEAKSKRLKRVEAAAANPVFFGEHYVRPFDEKWDRPLPFVAREILAFARRVRRGVIITPPEFLKTTMVSQLYPLWLTYRYAQYRKIGQLTGMLLSEEQDLAEGNLSVVTWHIEHNPRLAADFIDTEGRPLVEPDEEEDKWTDSEIVVRRPGASKDPTWSAKGLNSKGIQGKRLKHLIGDDLITPASADSPAKQKTARKLWDTQITTRVFEEGQAIIAGNFNNPKDLLSELGGKKSYRVLRRPAMYVDGDRSKPPTNPRSRNVELNLPERWSRLRLLRELAEKPASFPRIHLLRSGLEGGKLLRTSWVRRITLADVHDLTKIYIFGLDGAPGSEDAPDPSYFSITVAALTQFHFDVVESFADRCEPTEQVEVLAQKVKAYQELGHVGGIGVAKIALDRYFKGAVLVGHPELRPFLHEIPISEASKTDRLSHLGTYFRSGWARVVETAWSEQTASQEHREQEETLGEQWAALPYQHHDDRLDSLDVALREAVDRMGGGQPTVVSGGDEETMNGSSEQSIMERAW
jgi:hypothetical protein